MSPSPLGTNGSSRSHSIVSGLVGTLQGLQQHANGNSSIPHKPSRLHEESKPEQLPGPETKAPAALHSGIIHPGIPIASDKIGFFNHFRKSTMSDMQKDLISRSPCPTEASRPLVDDNQERSSSEPPDSFESAPNVEHLTLTDVEHELEADLAKLVGSRNPSVGIPDTPSLGHEERDLFSAALRALDSGLGGSLSSSGPSV